VFGLEMRRNNFAEGETPNADRHIIALLLARFCDQYRASVHWWLGSVAKVAILPKALKPSCRPSPREYPRSPKG
jgi:hypothetical protein